MCRVRRRLTSSARDENTLLVLGCEFLDVGKLGRSGVDDALGPRLDLLFVLGEAAVAVLPPTTEGGGRTAGSGFGEVERLEEIDGDAFGPCADLIDRRPAPVERFRFPA